MRARHILLLTFLFSCGFTFNTKAQDLVESKITLNLRNAQPEQYVFIKQLGQKEISVDSFWIDKPEITIQCTKQMLQEDLIEIHFQKRGSGLLFPLYADDVKIEMDMALCTDLVRTNHYAIIEGSIAAIEFQGVAELVSPLFRYKYNYYNDRIRELRQAGDADSLLNYYQEKKKAIRNLNIKWAIDIFKQTKSPQVALRIIGHIENNVKYNTGIAITDEEIKALYTEYIERFPQHYYAKSIAKRSANITRAGGNLYPFTLPDKQGKPVSLEDYRGRYVLLNFWASWSEICRQENFYLKKALQEFKDEGLTIISIGVDREKQDWQKAIEKDGLNQDNWIHLYEGKGFDGEVMKAYQVVFMPGSFLISPKGKILTMNLAIKGELLSQKLKEILQTQESTE